VRTKQTRIKEYSPLILFGHNIIIKNGEISVFCYFKGWKNALLQKIENQYLLAKVAIKLLVQRLE